MELDDLGALLGRLSKIVAALETPILEAHDLRMWDYILLVELARSPSATQTQLAAATGRDKTRLIGNLDRLEGLGLVHREVDAGDRRNRTAALTDTGLRVLRLCHAAILEMQDNLLAPLPATRRSALLRDLAQVLEHAQGPADGSRA